MGDYAIQMQFDIAADEATVWRALRTESGIRSWWSSRTRLSDDRLEVSFPDLPQPFEFAVRDAPERGLEWVTGGFPPWWAGTTVSWTVGPNPDKPGTRLQFRHGGYDPENPVIPVVTPAWAQIIVRLKEYAETGRPNPFASF